MIVLVTGSSGLVGSEAVAYYDKRGASVIGIDNNMRAQFFGPRGDTVWNLERLKQSTRRFVSHSIDIRDRAAIFRIFEEHSIDLVIHCAAQPSHDKAKEIPLIDFEVNALGTMNLLEATRRFCPEAVFIHMSTNKVYGDAPNEIPLVEKDTRWSYAHAEDRHGISETCRIDRTLHSLFGASKTAADIMAQEYGRYFGLKTGVFRGGCLTGSAHAGVELHGFLSYLIRALISGDKYTIFGYKGKQVRDQLHSIDVIRAVDAFVGNPRPGEVYNLGGGADNSISILEAIDAVEQATGMKLNWSYNEKNRVGDHICYVSDIRKLRRHYPEWTITVALKQIVEEMVVAETARLKG